MSTRTITVNHVLSSSSLKSSILDDLIRRFATAVPDDIRIVRSIRPIDDADVYHYHRVNRECSLKPGAVVTVHHDLDDPLGWLALGDFLPRYREASCVVCLNAGQAARLDRLGLMNLQTIPHGADLKVLKRVPLPALNGAAKITLGVISKRYPRGVKGEDRVTALMELLDPARFTFAFIGEGRWQDAEAARARGFEAWQFERLPYRLMGQAYGRIDALLMLSHFEGGPANVPEALATGRPVLATPVGLVPDMINDGVNGLILSGDAERDAPRIAKLADFSNGELAHLADGAGKTQLLNWDQVVERHVILYRAIAQNQSKRNVS